MTRNCLGVATAFALVFTLAEPASAQAIGSDGRPRADYNVSGSQPAHTLQLRWNDRFARTRASIANGDYRVARDWLERDQSRRFSAEGQYLLGVATSSMGDYQAAYRAFRQSLAIDTNHVGASVGTALLDIRFGRHDRAEQTLRAIEARRASCGPNCDDAAALDRAAHVIQRFLGEA